MELRTNTPALPNNITLTDYLIGVYNNAKHKRVSIHMCYSTVLTFPKGGNHETGFEEDNPPPGQLLLL